MKKWHTLKIFELFSEDSNRDLRLVTLYIVAVGYKPFGGPCCLHLQGVKTSIFNGVCCFSYYSSIRLELFTFQ